jgi:protein-S-isoprenylcysteine O-methyltransferase Ste14
VTSLLRGPWWRLAGTSLGVFAVMALAATLIERSAWQIQSTASWTLPAAGVLLVAALLWSATWVWRSYLLAQSELDAGASLTKQIWAFGSSVLMSVVACAVVGHLMYTQLFTWYAARYEGLTAADIRWVNGHTVRISGPIGLGTAYAFEQWLLENPGVRLVEFNSSIGLAPEGIHLGKLMRKHGLDGHVERECVGACVWALLGGMRLSVNDQAVVACHKPYMPIWGAEDVKTRADKAVLLWFETVEFDLTLIERCLTVPSWHAYELSF